MRDILLISIIQGITEFFPVSSSSHITVLGKILKFSAPGRVAEVALHIGTLFVVMIYFWRDVSGLIAAFFNMFRLKFAGHFPMLRNLIISTLPAIIAGFTIHHYKYSFGKTLVVVGWASIVAGIMMYAVDKTCPTTRKVDQMTFKDALIIGVLQIMAFIPGASRLGTTMTAARLLGFKRSEAARYSFLLSLPTILGAVVLVMTDFYKSPGVFFTPTLYVGLAVSFFVGLIALGIFMTMMRNITLTFIALYRVVFGAFLLYFSWA